MPHGNVPMEDGLRRTKKGASPMTLSLFLQLIGAAAISYLVAFKIDK